MLPAAADGLSIRRSYKDWKNLELYIQAQGGWYVEMAEIEIENVSRNAVTISDVGIDFGTSRWYRRDRRSVVPRASKLGNGSTETRIRLEPFDRVTFVLDVWQAIAGVKSSRAPVKSSFPRRLRATVRVAGKRRKALSPWRRGWVVKGDQIAFMDHTMKDSGIVAYQAIVRYMADHETGDAGMLAIPVALEIKKSFPLSGPPPTTEQIEEILLSQSELFKDNSKAQRRIDAYYIARDIESAYHQSKVLPPPEENGTGHTSASPATNQ
ncbi:hypothetical protein FB561_7371 [Kribbella amoyensis]|uniref:Uncharacterized protein n=2 Tax=Kribbella amoyensis TaxID=996641 RepID=A0A561B3M4_9ACTN|nr:hypothetical protein FB561_7371 [Kribbella amoyensis]